MHHQSCFEEKLWLSDTRLSMESLSMWYVEWMSETLQTVKAVVSKSRIFVTFSSLLSPQLARCRCVNGGCDKAVQKLNTPTHK